MKIRKIANLLKTGILLLGVSVLLWNCEKEETLEAPLEKNILETISITKAKELFEEFNKQKNNLLSKGSKEQFEFEPLWETIKQEALSFSDAQLTNLDIKPKVKLNYKPKLFFIKINGYNIKAFETTIAEEVYNTGKIKKGVVYYHSIEGDFMTGYRVKNGRIVTRLKQKQKLNKAGFLSFFFQECSGTEINIGDLNGGCFDEVTVYGSLETMDEFMSVYNTSGNFYPTESNTNGGSGDGIVDNGGNGGGPLESHVKNKLTNKCGKDVFTELENGIFQEDPVKPEVEILAINTTNLNFSQEILHLFSSSNNTHLTIQNGSLTGKNASTTGATITISDNYLANATKLAIARTMIHESIHAYINALYKNVVHFNSFSFRDKIEQYAKDNGFTIGTNRFHHEFMGQYVNAIAISLYEWDKEYGSGKYNNNVTKPDDLLGWDYYKAMAYGGMFQVDPSGNIVTETDTFKELVPNSSDRQEIADIIISEQNNNNDAKGTKC